jgi:arylsulfatase A
MDLLKGAIVMNRRVFLRHVASTAAVCAAGGSFARAAGAPPNIIFIMTDDQGWTSVSYRSDPDVPESESDYIETPRMRGAALAGMRFTDGYAPNPICSPTRHSIIFGQNAARHVYCKDPDWGGKAPGWLTIPKAIKAANPAYRTAHFGKWHVALMPEDAGFDFSDGPSSNSAGDLSNGEYWTRDGVQENLEKYNEKFGITPPTLNSKYSELPVYLTDDDPKGAVGMTRRAGTFIRESVADGTPFFAYIAHYATHLDMISSKESQEYFKGKPRGKKHDNPGYAAMVKDMDTAIGDVLDLVEELGIQDNTYIFIMSDNGGVQYFGQTAVVTPDREVLETYETSLAWRNLPLRHGKHEFYEGGIRVPFMVLGPDIEPNSVCRVPVTGLDLLPTFADLAGHNLRLPDNIDGGSMVSVLRGGGTGRVRRNREAIVFHQAAKRIPISALRKGRYKLVKHWLADDPGDEGGKYKGEKLLELYDLSKDIEEKNDLSEEMRDLTNALHKELLSFLEEANGETKYTSRSDAYSSMLKEHGLGHSSTVIPDAEYTSPFVRKQEGIR